jgi:hypothetical protein
MPSLIQQIFAQRGNILNKQNVLDWFMKTTFDDNFATRDEVQAFRAHHGALNLMLKEDFVIDATTKTANTVQTRAAKLITRDPWSTPEEGKEMELWEQPAQVRFCEDGTFDANLYTLIVHFVGQITIDMLWGKALIKNHPGLQTDMWDFDAGVHHLVTKMLRLSPSGRRALSARDRLTASMQEWHDAVALKQAGGQPDAKWGDLDDISQIMQHRAKLWVENKASDTLIKTNDASILWGVNANSNKNIFWMLMQVHTRPELLSDIREEIAPYVHISATDERDDDGLPKLDIDVDGLMKHCPLIKATFYETMRMNMSGLGVRQVQQEVTLKEAAVDAAMFGKSKPQSYTIPAGSTLVLSNGTMQMDARIFAEPETFNPARFLEEGADGTVRAQMRNLHTFGGGMYKCKGRYFAEKQVLIIASSLLVMWDMAPVKGEELKVPDMSYAGASRSPLKDVRVKLTRRYN